MATSEKSIREAFGQRRPQTPTVAVSKPKRSPQPAKEMPPQMSPAGLVKPPNSSVGWIEYTSDKREVRKMRERQADASAEFPGPGEPIPPELQAWQQQEGERSKRKQQRREALEKAFIENAKQLQAAGVDSAVPGHKFTLTKAHDEVTLVARPWKYWAELERPLDEPKATRALGDGPAMLTVTGLGAYAGKRKPRLGLIDMTAFDLSNRVVEKIGITSDGTLVLPDTAARVYFRLRDLNRKATVSLDRYNRIWYGDGRPIPTAWLVRQKWNPPKGDDFREVPG